MGEDYLAGEREDDMESLANSPGRRPGGEIEGELWVLAPGHTIARFLHCWPGFHTGGSVVTPVSKERFLRPTSIFILCGGRSKTKKSFHETGRQLPPGGDHERLVPRLGGSKKEKTCYPPSRY